MTFAMKIFVFFLVVALLGSPTTGLRCWKCDNAKSRSDCIKSGRSQQCRVHQKMACQTEVRFHRGWGEGPIITTGCKERNACSNNQAQNPRAAWSPSQCNAKSFNSVCRCCCVGFNCNRMNLLCRKGNSNSKNKAFDESRTKPFPTATESTPSTPIANTDTKSEEQGSSLLCEDLGGLEHGTISCTRTVKTVGTVCTFSCLDGFNLKFHLKTICVHHRGMVMWNNKKPPCVRKPQVEVCPPVAKRDIVIVLDSSGSVSKGKWEDMKDFVGDLIGKFDVSQDSVQFAVIRFNSRVDTETQILFPDYSSDVDGLRSAVKLLPKKGSGTRLGRALKYAKDHVLTKGNREDADDLILVVTDGKTKNMPLVIDVSRELKDNGVEIVALGIPNSGEEGFVEQLVTMTGSSDRVVLMDDVLNNFSEKLILDVARKICNRKLK